MGVKLAALLKESGYVVSAYDPMAMPAANLLLHNNLVTKKSVLDCVTESDILIITTDWPEFREQLTQELLARASSPRIIIDCWRMLSDNKLASVADIYYLGNGCASVQCEKDGTNG